MPRKKAIKKKVVKAKPKPVVKPKPKAPRKKHLSLDEFKDMVRAEVKRNEMRELSQGEDRDPLEHFPDYVHRMVVGYVVKGLPDV